MYLFTDDEVVSLFDLFSDVASVAPLDFRFEFLDVDEEEALCTTGGGGAGI